MVIDFSSPKALKKILELCLKNKVPLVTGTTGLSLKQKQELKKASKKIPILYSSNMSVGVNLLSHLVEALPQLKDFHFFYNRNASYRKKRRSKWYSSFFKRQSQKNKKSTQTKNKKL